MKEDHRSQRRNFAVAKTKPEKIQPCSGFKPLTSMIPVQRSTNWANKQNMSRLSKRFVIKPSRCVYDCDDLLSYISSPSSSYIWFSYTHCFVVILLWVYGKLTQRPAPSWLVGLIGRTMHRERRGQGFESRTSLMFFMLSFRNCKSCVYNRVDLLSFKTKYCQITKRKTRKKNETTIVIC